MGWNLFGSALCLELQSSIETYLRQTTEPPKCTCRTQEGIRLHSSKKTRTYRGKVRGDARPRRRSRYCPCQTRHNTQYWCCGCQQRPRHGQLARRGKRARTTRASGSARLLGADGKATTCSTRRWSRMSAPHLPPRPAPCPPTHLKPRPSQDGCVGPPSVAAGCIVEARLAAKVVLGVVVAVAGTPRPESAPSCTSWL